MAFIGLLHCVEGVRSRVSPTRGFQNTCRGAPGLSHQQTSRAPERLTRGPACPRPLRGNGSRETANVYGVTNSTRLVAAVESTPYSVTIQVTLCPEILLSFNSVLRVLELSMSGLPAQGPRPMQPEGRAQTCLSPGRNHFSRGRICTCLASSGSR